MENKTQMIRSAGTAIADRMAPITEAKAMSAQSINPAMNVRMMSLKAALLALPEYFMCSQGKAWPSAVKGKRSLEFIFHVAHNDPICRNFLLQRCHDHY